MNTEPKMTPWFVNGEKPARNGVYAVNSRMGREHVFSHWNGDFWGWVSESVATARHFRNRPTPREFKSVIWRGLAEKP